MPESGESYVSPEGRRGGQVPVELHFDERLKRVAASCDYGQTKALHDLIWRRTSEIEAEGRGSTVCGDESEQSQSR